jgi:hypothetical protein
MGNVRLTCYDKFALMQRFSQGLRHFSGLKSIPACSIGFKGPFQRDGEVTPFRYPAKTNEVKRLRRHAIELSSSKRPAIY